MRDCLSSVVQLLTCGLLRLRAREPPEAAAPLLSAPSPQRRRKIDGHEHRRRRREREQAPDTTHVLAHGHRDISQDYVLTRILGQGGRLLRVLVAGA